MVAGGDDAIEMLRSLHGDCEAEGTLETLRTVPVDTQVLQLDGPVTEPILTRRQDGSPGCRYWEGIVGQVREQYGDAPVTRAIELFDKALNHPAARFQVTLAAGEVVLLDNDRVAHGHRTLHRFLGEGEQGRLSSRVLYNIHVFSDLRVTP